MKLGRELMARLLERAGLNTNSAARKVKGSQPQLHRYMSGKAREPKRSTLLPFAKLFGVPVDAFFDDRVAAQELAKLNDPQSGIGEVDQWDIPGPAQKLFIVRAVQATSGPFVQGLDLPSDLGLSVPYYGRDPDVYGLVVRGNWGADRILSGDRLIVEPNTTPLPGDVAVVVLRGDRMAISRILSLRGDEVELAPIAGGSVSNVFPMSDVSEMHKVVAILPR